MGFKPVASALALQCSTSLSYEDPYTGGWPIYWVHQPVKGMKHRMKWCELWEYKIMKWICDHRSELQFNKQLRKSPPKKKSFLQVIYFFPCDMHIGKLKNLTIHLVCSCWCLLFASVLSAVLKTFSKHCKLGLAWKNQRSGPNFSFSTFASFQSLP